VTDHRIAALKTLGYIRQAYEDSRATALASEATAHALLYVGDQVRALVSAIVNQHPAAEPLAPVDADDAETVDEYDEDPPEDSDGETVQPGSEKHDPDVAYERDVIDAANGL
jgi:hypothetical protein